jgi:hypothetical protein
MGAGVYWIIKVLKVVEDEVEVHAVTQAEAMSLAAQRPDVVRALHPVRQTENEWESSSDL